MGVSRDKNDGLLGELEAIHSSLYVRREEVTLGGEPSVPFGAHFVSS